MLRGLQKRHLRGIEVANKWQQTANEQAKTRHCYHDLHWSSSLNFNPEMLREVMTVVSSSNCPKSVALANARFMFTDSNSCKRCTRISKPAVRYRTQPMRRSD